MTAPEDLPVYRYKYEPDDPDWVEQFADGVTAGYLVVWNARTGRVYGHAPVAVVAFDGEGFIAPTHPEEGTTDE